MRGIHCKQAEKRLADALSILLAFGGESASHTPTPFLFPLSLSVFCSTTPLSLSLFLSFSSLSLSVFCSTTPLSLSFSLSLTLSLSLSLSLPPKMEVLGGTMEEMAAHAKTLKANHDATFSEPMKRYSIWNGMSVYIHQPWHTRLNTLLCLPVKEGRNPRGAYHNPVMHVSRKDECPYWAVWLSPDQQIAVSQSLAHISCYVPP